MTITIRPAASADLAAVGDVHVRSRTAAYAGIVPAGALDAVSGAAMGQWWSERWLYERDTHRMAVAVDRAGRVLGFTYVGPCEHSGSAATGPGQPEVLAQPAAARTGELYAIHVDPERQGVGIGRALMGEALRALVSTGAGRAVLWVLADNAAARRFYERGGWACDPQERMAPIGPVLTRQVRYSRPLDTRLGGST